MNSARASQLGLIKKTDKELLREMLYQMVLGRHFEEKSRRSLSHGQDRRFLPSLYRSGSDRRRLHAALEPTDMVITSYRDHVQAMVKGITPEAVMAELYGKEGGCVKGKGGSMHMFSKELSSMAATASSAARSASEPEWLSPLNIKERAR